LQPVGPSPLVLGVGRGRLSDTVPALETLCPFSSVQPPPPGLYAQPVSLAVLPLALESVAAAKKNNIVMIIICVYFVQRP